MYLTRKWKRLDSQRLASPAGSWSIRIQFQAYKILIPWPPSSKPYYIMGAWDYALLYV